MQFSTTNAQNDQPGRPTCQGVEVVITTCTHRKTIDPESHATAVSLPIGPQELVETVWRSKIQAERPVVAARALYGGRGFHLATEAARNANAKLYIISAGLGLIADTQKVPTYGITVARDQRESVARRVTERFDPAKWFSTVLSSAFSKQWPDVVGRSGRILISLTRPYAEMVGASLMGLSPAVLSRLRIFGASLEHALPKGLRPAIAPYDARLDAILPGTRADFSQRALFHFVKSVLPASLSNNRAADFDAVLALMKTATSPERKRRPRRTDDEILRHISIRLDQQDRAGRILRALRDEDGVACEQSRFKRLYAVAVERRSGT